MESLRKSNPTGMLGTFLASCILALSLCGCGRGEVTPVDIGQHELCARCRSLIAEKQYAAEFITKDGFVRKFDDLSCLIDHAGRVKRNSIAAVYAMDYASQQWIKGEEARFVRSDKFQTPQNGGILAFKNHEQAEALANQYKAELLTIDEVLK